MGITTIIWIISCLLMTRADYNSYGCNVVEIDQGLLRGCEEELVTGDGTFYSFRGVYYGAPPVGDMRFMPPQPPRRWLGIKNATAFGDACIYYDNDTQSIIGSEDCLNLNIYTPTLEPTKLLAVMVFFHGGDFLRDSANSGLYGPDFLVQQNVVVVNVNFRLGVFGFLSLESKEVPGNNGLKDQVAALRWVKRNIAKFGGDPDNVTIFGGSSGGSSVCFHTLSPLSKGLFKRAIAMSGSPLNDFSTAFQPRRHAIALGKKFGIYLNDSAALLEFLQSIPAEQLIFAKPSITVTETVMHIVDKINYFTPVIEKDFGGEHFLTVNVIKALETGRVSNVDLMIGYTKDEAINSVANYLDEILIVYRKYPEMLVPAQILINALPCRILTLSDTICRRYMNGLVSLDQIQELVIYFSDTTYTNDIIRFLRHWPSVGNVYQYRFSTYSSRNIYGRRLAQYGLTGVSHRDDLLYLFNADNLTVNVNSEEYRLVIQTVTLFTNFAKYGNPTPDQSLGVIWPQYNILTQRYLDIGNVLSTGTCLGEETYNFWKGIYEYVNLPY